MSKIISLTFVTFLSFVPAAQAAILFTPSLSFVEQKADDTTDANPESNANMTLIDLRLGYTFDFGLYIGGLYSIHDQALLTSGEDSSDSYFGPSVGYYYKGLLVVFSYYLYGEKDLANGSGKMQGVNGYQLDVGYSVPVTDTIHVGPQLTYHTIKFDEISSGVGSNTINYEFSGISPYFNVTFIF